MVTDLQGALADWSRYLTGLGTLVVNLVVAPTLAGTEQGGPTVSVPDGTTVSGATLVEASSVYELATGRHYNGAASDITITIDPNYAKMLFLNPSPGNGAAIPSNKIDALSVFRHELGHGFGIDGYFNSAGVAEYGSGIGGYLTNFDTLIRKNANGTADFIGPHAEAVFAGAVPLTTDYPAENYYHLANATTDLNGQDLMNGQALNYGTSYQISSLDLAILKDTGAPVTTADTIAGTPGYFGPTSEVFIGLHGAHGQYTISGQQDGAVLLQDRVAGRDSTGELGLVTILTFTDGRGIADASGVAEDVDRLYQAAFNRSGDAVGVQQWTAAVHAGTTTLGGLAQTFTQSAEFIADNGPLSNTDYVQALYRNALGRTGETAGIAGWSGALANGVNRGQVLTAFASSNEAVLRSLPNDGSTGEAEVTRLYQAAFNRAPDPGGQQLWMTTLANGATPLQVAQQFAASAEFARIYAGLNDPAFVNQLYVDALHRAPDAAGAQSWAAQIAGGASRAQVMLAFADCNESRSLTAGITHDGWAYLG